MPATKTFTAQLAAVALVAEALGPVPWSERRLGSRCPSVVEELLADPGPGRRAAAELLGDADELVAVGRGYLMCVALEAALKLREATGVRAEGWSAADFRHGPVTVARGDIPLLAVSASGPAAADVEELAGELERGGNHRCCAWPTARTRPCPTRAAWRSRSARCRPRCARSSWRWRSPCGAGSTRTSRPGCARSRSTT